MLGSQYEWKLDLEAYDLKASDYLRRVVGGEGITESKGKKIVTYRGGIHGDPNSKVRISYFSPYSKIGKSQIVRIRIIYF